MAEDENIVEEVEEIREIDEYDDDIEAGFLCSDCKVEFDSPEDFAEHLDKSHGTNALTKVINLEDLVCPECKFIFTRKNNLWRHVRKFHKHLTPPYRQISYDGLDCHSCPACDRKFTRKSNLLRHIRRFHEFLISSVLHQNPKLYNCPECNTGFTKWNNCKRHVKHFHSSLNVDQLQKPKIKEMMAHFSETTFEDDSIDQSLIEADEELTVLPCVDCNLVFTSNNELDQHIELSHSISDDIKTYEKKTCPLCSFYDSKLNMYLHFTSAHDSPIMIECLDFDSLEEFTKWRDSIEIENRIQFVELMKKHQPDGDLRAVYMCSLSKESAEKCDDGGFCPAEITLSLTPEKCSILFVKTHIGHDDPKIDTITDEIICE